MKKYGKRIVAFALAMTIALGSVCYRPPKAEALTGIESLFVSAACSSYMGCLGYSLQADNQQAINEAFAKQMFEFAKAVYNFPMDSAEAFWNNVGKGIKIVGNGVIQLSHEACDVFKRFSDWLIDKFNLIGEDGTPVAEPAPVLPSVGNEFIYNGVEAPALPIDALAVSYMYVSPFSGAVLLSTSDACRYEAAGIQHIGAYRRYKAVDGIWTLISEFENGVLVPTGDMVDLKPFWTNTDIFSVDGSLFCASSVPVPIEDWANPDVSVGLSPDYEAAPTVDEQYAMVIDTGMTFEDEQEMIDQILGGIAAGTFSPTYTIENTAGGDVTVPDEGDDTEDDTPSGILSWTKKIWQSVTELPDTIARAVAEVFVPSEEYMTALPDTITATFDGRTGFLTYPASVLYDFGDMLSKGAADFILEWPEVRVPPSNAVLLDDGSFNVSKFVRDNDDLSMVYELYQFVVSAYLTFLFLGLCRRKYNSVIGDRLEG